MCRTRRRRECLPGLMYECFSGGKSTCEEYVCTPRVRVFKNVVYDINFKDLP